MHIDKLIKTAERESDIDAISMILSNNINNYDKKLDEMSIVLSDFKELAKDIAKWHTHKNDKLLTAIKETIEDNLELADGNDCTLIKLKRAIEEA